MHFRVALVAGVFLGACGPAADGRTTDAGPSVGDGGVVGGSGQDQPIKFNSGTRIKAKVTNTSISTADGAKYTSSAFAGWYDAARQEDCSPKSAGDGKIRCLPATMNTPYYADAACTAPAALVVTDPTPGCSPPQPKYLGVLPPAACPQTGGTRVYRLGPTITTFYSKSSTGTCSGPATSPGLSFYTLGAEVPVTEFAEMTSTTSTQ